MKIRSSSFAVLWVALSVGVASSAAAQFTTPPAPANLPALIDQYLEGSLKDPYSAVKRMTRGPRYGHLPSLFVSRPPGWIVCYSINAKNSYGGYGGAETYVFVVGEAGVLQQLHSGDDRDAVDDECGQPADQAGAAAQVGAPAENPKTPL